MLMARNIKDGNTISIHFLVLILRLTFDVTLHNVVILWLMELHVAGTACLQEAIRSYIFIL